MLRRAVVAPLVTALVLSAVVSISAGRAEAQEAPGGGLSSETPGMVVDPTSAANETVIVDGRSLADMDPYTGEVHGDARDASAEAAISDVFEAGQLAIDHQAIEDLARAQALERARSQASAGCPSSVPPGTMRNGSESVGAAELCRRSSEAAITPQAAGAIQFMFDNLGKPYSQPQRMQDGFFDCSSYVMRAYASTGLDVLPSGWAPSTHTIGPHPGYSSYPWLETISPGDATPGDLLLWIPDISPYAHVAALLTDGYMIHTDANGDVSHVSSVSSYLPPALYRRVLPDRV